MELDRDEIYGLLGEETIILRNVQKRLSDPYTLRPGEKFDLGKSLLYVLEHLMKLELTDVSVR